MQDKLVYENDGDCWKWHRKSAEDEDGRATKYLTTNAEGDGIFLVDLKKNERSQLVGTADFSLKGLKDPKAKIRKWNRG